MIWWTARRRLMLALLGGSAAILAQTIDPREIRLSAVPYFPRAANPIHAESRLVDVGVVVRDGRGHPVSGLDKSDFQVWDNGKRHEVTAFSVQTFVPAVSTSAAAAPSQSTSGGATVKPRFVGLVFDDIDMPPGDLFHAKAAARQFVKDGLAVNDRVAVMTISSGLVLPFTADKAALSEAIDKVAWREKKILSNGCPLLTPYVAYLIANKMDQNALEVKAEELMVCNPCICSCSGGSSQSQKKEGGSSAATACRAALDQTQHLSTTLWEEVRAQSLDTIATVRNMVDFLARMNGTRVMLLASSGFLAGTLEFDQDLVIERALRAGVVINSLDAKGLFVEDAPETGLGGGVRSVTLSQTLGTRPKEAANDAIGNLADSTGGLFFRNSNDLARGFRELGMQPETSYLLGFVPDPADGKYHRLRVSLTTRRRESVQARKGYMAVAAAEQKPAPERRLDREVMADSQLSDVPLTVTARADKLENGQPVARLTFRWDVSRMRFHVQDGARQQKVRLVAALLDEHGNFVIGREGVVEFALSEATYAWAASAGMNLSMSLEAPAGVYRLRTVAVEDGDEHVSSGTQALELK